MDCYALALACSVDGSFLTLFVRFLYLCSMTYHHICPQFTPTSSHFLLNRPPSQTHGFKNNLLSVLIGVYMCIGSSTRTWKIYQKASAQRRIAFTSPQVINCQELLSKESHEDDLFHLCWLDSVKVITAALSS